MCRIVCAACALLIAGCSSVDTMRLESPVSTMNSAKDASAVAGCITLKLGEVFEAPLAADELRLRTRPASNGHTVWVEQNTYFGIKTNLVIDVTDAKIGSVTRTYYHIAPMYVSKALIAIRDCQCSYKIQRTDGAGLY